MKRTLLSFATMVGLSFGAACSPKSDAKSVLLATTPLHPAQETHLPTLTGVFVRGLQTEGGVLLWIRKPSDCIDGAIRTEWELPGGQSAMLDTLPTNRQDIVCAPVPAEYPDDVKRLGISAYDGLARRWRWTIDVPPSSRNWPASRKPTPEIVVGPATLAFQAWPSSRTSSPAPGRLNWSYRVRLAHRTQDRWQLHLEPPIPEFSSRVPGSPGAPIDEPLSVSAGHLFDREQPSPFACVHRACLFRGRIDSAMESEETVSFKALHLSPYPRGRSKNGPDRVLDHPITARTASGASVTLSTWSPKSTYHYDARTPFLRLTCRVDDGQGTFDRALGGHIPRRKVILSIGSDRFCFSDVRPDADSPADLSLSLQGRVDFLPELRLTVRRRYVTRSIPFEALVPITRSKN